MFGCFYLYLILKAILAYELKIFAMLFNLVVAYIRAVVVAE